jgi:hypothetical protein
LDPERQEKATVRAIYRRFVFLRGGAGDALKVIRIDFCLGPAKGRGECDYD